MKTEVTMRIMASDKIAKVALDNHLYECKWWMLKGRLECCLRNPDSYEAAIAYAGEMPVGVCISNNHNHQMMVYVKPEFRHQYIGRILVCLLKKDNSWGRRGSDPEAKIYKLNGIRLD